MAIGIKDSKAFSRKVLYYTLYYKVKAGFGNFSHRLSLSNRLEFPVVDTEDCVRNENS